MNRLHVGNTCGIADDLPDRYLFLDDGEFSDALTFPKEWKVTRLDLSRDRFNPLQGGITYREAKQLIAILYAARPQGENTLTVRNGRRALAKLLSAQPERLDLMQFDTSDAQQEAKGMIDDLLLSPALKNFLCSPTNLSLDGILLVRLDRTTLDEDDCFIIGNLLISRYQRQIVVPDFGFYGRPFHASLIRQDRLIAGVNFLDESTLRDQLLLIKDKRAGKCTVEDARTLADFKGIIPDPMRAENDYTKFIRESVGS
jgi:hypothetical protein